MARIYVSFAPRDFQTVFALCGNDCERFKYLPVLSADLNPDEAGSLRRAAEVYIHYSDHEAYLPMLRALDRIMGEREPVVVNKSLSPLPGSFEPREPMNVATRIAAQAGHMLVYAAGNNGPGEDTISPWAKAPWVIAVGATDESGTRLLETSGIGSPGDPATHPTVVACGRTVVPLSPDHMKVAHGTMVGLVLIGKEGGGRDLPGYEDMVFEGTSVSAPRVTRICSLIERMVSYIAATATWLNGQTMPAEAVRERVLASETVHAPGFGFDGAASPMYVPFVDFFIGLGRRGIRPADLPFSSGSAVPFPTNILKTLLQRMARPVDGYGRHQVGAGFVDDSLAMAYLARLSTLEMLGLFFGDRGADLARGWKGVDLPMLSTPLLQHFRKHVDERAELTSVAVMQ